MQATLCKPPWSYYQCLPSFCAKKISNIGLNCTLVYWYTVLQILSVVYFAAAGNIRQQAPSKCSVHGVVHHLHANKVVQSTMQVIISWKEPTWNALNPVIINSHAAHLMLNCILHLDDQFELKAHL